MIDLENIKENYYEDGDEKIEIIEARVKIEYWEDSKVDGEWDIDGNMPLRLKNNIWNIRVYLDDGRIVGWPVGTNADIFYRVGKSGKYSLMTKKKKKIATFKERHVPNDIFCINNDGWGEYMIFCIGRDGKIKNWKKPVINYEEWKPE